MKSNRDKFRCGDTTSPPPCDTSPPRVATSSELIIRGNDKGTDFPLSHENDACLVNLNTSCVDLPIDLSTSAILENHVTIMNASCDQTTKIPTILSAPIELTVDAKESCELENQSDLDKINLKIIVPMFNHFDMTSNLGDHSVSNDLLHVFLFKHVVACKFDARKVYSPMLGLFNDEYCQSFDMNKRASLICTK